MAKRSEESDAAIWKADLRRLVTGVNLVVLILAVGVGVWGVIDSLVDARGDRVWGTLVIVAPGIYAGWCMLQMAWRRLESQVDLLVRMFTACLFASFALALIIGAFQAVLVAFPAVRDTIAEATRNNGFHHFWDDGIETQLLLGTLGGWAIGMCISLAVLLIIVLPVVSIRQPEIVMAGSHITKVEEGKRDATTALVYCGIGMLVLGSGLWVFGDGDSLAEFPGMVASVFRGITRYGRWYGDEIMFVAGVVFVGAGLVLAGIACVRVVAARRAASRS